MSVQKLAVIFGSNYYGQNQLHGCINDANDIKNFLINTRGFDASNVLTLYDKQMTRVNMFKAFDDLVAQSQAIAEKGQTPAVFFYYSGHGVQVPDRNHIEKDGMAEAMVPYDFEQSDLILDEDLYQRLMKRLNPRTQLFFFTDCCNSGTLFNLAYTNFQKVYSGHEVKAAVIGLSGCTDTQTSAEVSGHGVATAAFLKTMQNPSSVTTVAAFAKKMSDVSIAGHKQTPEVSVSRADLFKGNMFPWLVQNVATPQLSQKTLRQLALKHKAKLFLSGVASNFRRAT